MRFETVPKRIPVDLLPIVEEMIDAYRREVEEKTETARKLATEKARINNLRNAKTEELAA